MSISYKCIYIILIFKYELVRDYPFPDCDTLNVPPVSL